MSKRLEALAIAFVALLLACATALPHPSVFEGPDWPRLHLLNRVYANEALWGGRLPLWNPWVTLGRPFLADTETAVLYPPNLLYLFVPPQESLFLLLVIHLAVAVAGMLRLGRLLGFPPWLAWLQAAVFPLSGALVVPLVTGQIPYVQAMCYVPLVLAMTIRLQDETSVRRIAPLATLLGLQLLCGHPQIAWLTWLGLAAFAVGRVSFGRSGWRSTLAGWAAIAASLALALGMSAAMLFPFAELAGSGNRSSPTLEFASGGTMEWREWLSLFVPATRSLFTPADQYFGLLVAVGVVGLCRPNDRNGRGLLAAGALGFLLAAGPRTPIFSLLFYAVPGVAQLHLHGRAAFLLSFALILGTGLVLREPLGGPLRTTVLSLSAAIALVSTLVAKRLEPNPTTWLAEPVPRLVLLGLVLALVIPSTLPGTALRAAAARTALALVVLGELTLAQQSTRASWSLPSPSAGERPLFEALSRAGLYSPSGVPPRVLVPPWIVRDNAGLIYKWSNVSGYNALTLDRVWLYVHARLGLTPPVHENTYPSDQVFERGPFPYDSMNLVVGWDSVSRRLVGRPDPDSRAYMVAAVRSVGHWQEAVHLLAAGHDGHREALVEEAVPGIGTSHSRTRERQDVGVVQIESFAPERVVVRTAADTPQLLVLAEAYYPGWEAKVDDRPVACIPANGWMRAAPVPAGRHSVTFTFRSRWLPVGCLISALSLGVIVFLGRRGTRPRRRNP